MSSPTVSRRTRRTPRPDRLRRAVRCAVVLAAVCALGLSPGNVRPAEAQEEGGTEAPAQLPTKAFTDNDGIFKVQLPTEWKLFKDLQMTNKLGAWMGPMLPHDEKNATSMFAVQLNPSFRRALLAGSIGAAGKPVEGESRQGPGFHEVCFRPEKGPTKFEWHRHVEAHGRLYTVIAATVHDDIELARPVVHKWFDSFELVKAPKDEEVPEGWTAKKVKGVDVWTDSEDKKEVQRAAELVNTAADMLKKVLPGKPFMTEPLRIRFFQQASEYNDACSKAFGGEPDFAGFDFSANCIYVKGLRTNAGDYEDAMYRVGADAAIRRHFGGRIPEWLRRGLLHYAEFAALSGGKPKKLDARFINTAKPIAQTSRQLDTWFDLDFARSGDTSKSATEVFAWVWFLNHGKAPKSASKALENYLKVLHKTGDESEARKAWKDVDFAKLHEAMKEFAADWD